MRRIQRSLGRGGRTDIRGKQAWETSRFSLYLQSLDAARAEVPIFRCACDVPAHNYTWSFEPKLDWSAVYASSKEIFNYFDNFARKYHLRDYVKTHHQVTGAFWNHQKGGYDVRVHNIRDGQEVNDHCDILINASGILNNWRWPAIPGLKDYKGTLLHTANWNDNVELEGKHVGLIGNG